MTESDFNNVKRKYQDLSLDLNLDQATADEAWSNYENIQLRYTLEGEQLPWLVCALYAACRRRSVPTVGGRPGNVIQGNCVSLTRMLQHSNLPLTEFIKKMKHWLAMSNNDEAFCNRIELLERNFAVANNIFKKYKPIFLDLFKNPSEDAPRPPRSRKQRRPPCNATELFHFCWTIYILIKGKYPSIPQDLVSCYSLLLAAIDLIYANVVLANRRDLLNPNCKGLPEGLLSEESTIEDLSSVPVSIMDYLCKKFEGVLVETKVVREYYWNKHIRDLIDSKVLKGGPEGTGIIDLTNFDHNVKEVKNAYEEYLLSCGEFDERMFLNEDQIVGSIGVSAITSPSTPSHQNSSTASASPADAGSLKNARRSLVQSFEGDHHLVPQTPITGKSYTIDRPSVGGTPLTVVTSGLQKLYTLLAGRKNSPTPELIELFQSCSTNQEENIKTQICGLSESFCRLYTRSTEDYTGPSMEFAQLRVQMAQMLYYTFLEHILLDERKRGVHVEAILKEELFHRTLFTCCIEIVLRSYNDPRRFPWSLQVGCVEPYYFIRIIEPVIRSEKQSDNQLSRELVKHLKGIEEQILDSLAWRRDSPLWQLLTNKGCQVPSCADVNFSDQLETADAAAAASSTITAATPLSLGLISSVMSPALKPLVNDKTPHSPVSTLNDSFRSPLGQSSARRTLFPTSSNGGGLSSALAFSRPSTLGTRLFTPNTASATASTTPQTPGTAAALLTRSPAANKITLQVKENGVTTLYTLPSTAAPLPTAATITTTTAAVGTPTTAAFSTAQTTPASEAKSDVSSEATPNTQKKEKPKRAGSLALFFRKFYTLANMRLRDLCDRLDITDLELRRKVWTCFEHSIIHYNTMLKDRHMDQMVMCAIYITCKVTGKDRIFQEIMKHYRNQPQAASHVYRSVLIMRSTTTQPQTEGLSNATTTPAGNKMLSSLPPPTPSQMTGTSSSFETEERGDLIKFYNHVYVQKIKTFALKFRGTHEGDQPPLSPLPVVRHTPVSPRRKISNNHSVFINSLSPMQGNTPHSPRRPLPYYFNRSPAKDLRVINTMLKLQQDGSVGTRKRILGADDSTDLQSSGIELKRPLMHSNINRRLMQGVLGDRSEAQLSGLIKNNISSSHGNGGGPPATAITGIRMETENTVDTDSGTLPLATLHHNGHATLHPQ